MIKKVLIIFLIVILLFPIDALANDGGAMLDDNKYLSISIKLDSKEAEIDGDFSFTITLRNKSKDLIQLMNITQIFKGDDVYENDTFKEYVDDVQIRPGEKLKLDLKTIVPKTNIFYKQDDEYYTNLNFNIIYDLLPLDETNDYEERHWFYKNKIQSIPIKITNIYDGSEYLKLELVEEQTTFYFTDNYHTESITYEGEYPASIHGIVIATNISDTKINLLQDEIILDSGKTHTSDISFFKF